MVDYHNPLSVIIPHEFHGHQEFPTEVVAQRFQAYRDIVKDLISYLRQFCSVQEEIVRQQVRLQQAVGAPSRSQAAEKHSGQGNIHTGSRSKEKQNGVNSDEISAINSFFLPIGNGSIQDIPTILTKFHQQNIQSGTKTLKEITQVIIPKLEDLRKDLLVKVKEIKNLQNDFKNSLSKEVSETRTMVASFSHAIEVATHFDKIGSSTSQHHDTNSDIDAFKKDPFLVKVKLERQLRKQLNEEAYLYEAYKNLQVSSEKLESIVVVEIQHHMGLFLSLVENESSSVPNFLVPSFTNGFLAKEPNLEWDAFVERNLPRSSSISHNLTSGMFIDLSFPTRKISDLAIPHYDSLLNVAVREGMLERRSKFLKSYSGGWYVLTCSYLHEFKSADRKRDQHPVMSLSLDHCSVSEHSKNDGKGSGAYKFVLYSKSKNGLIHRGHNWSFRCDNYNTMIEWYNDLNTLTSLATPSARAKAMNKKLTANNTSDDKLSRTVSAMSGHSGVKSLRSTGSKLRDVLSCETTSSPTSSRQYSHHSTATPALTKRSMSRSKHKSPKLSNLINSDGTAVASLEDHTKETESVEPNGDATLRTSVSSERVDTRLTKPPSSIHLRPVDTSAATHIGMNGDASPQQTIPQNYQYYINQVNQQPQQFFDPVSQQFFTINAIPASHVTQMDSATIQSIPYTSAQSMNAPQPQGPKSPMPQYFPSSPLPSQNTQTTPGSPSLYSALIQSPPLQQGSYVVQNDGKRLSQNIPNFRTHLIEDAASNTPYPVHSGSAFETGAQSAISASQEPAYAMARKTSINEEVSRLALNDERDV